VLELEELRKIYRGHAAVHEPLNKYTSFRIGGPADCFLEPADKHDAVEAVRYLRRSNIPFMIMGRGSNMLVSDDGIRGAVINFEQGLNKVWVDGDRVRAEAGVGMARFVDFCIQHDFAGVEMLPGIPGTIGGAVMMNAGAYGGETADHLADVEVLRGDSVVTVPKAEAGFSYRRSGFQDDIILAASFLLPRGEKGSIINRRRELLVKRNATQPLNMPNSGSMFKNPPGTHAAKLIEDAGLKGTVRGKAQISEKHGNFFLNLGGAKAADIVELIKLARDTVKKKSGVQLELEVKLVGFSDAILKSVYA
jgi:UDP-N-acetylmuramate dehydrogenase